MISGFNTEIKHKGVLYHIQTEDKGKSNPIIETLVYQGGAILASRRTSYEEHLEKDDCKRTIAKLMENQHKEIILKIKNEALFEEQDEETKTYSVDQSGPQEAVADGPRTLDQVILDFLQESKSSKSADDDFDIFLPREVKLFVKSEVSFDVYVKNVTDKTPLKDVTVGIKLKQKTKHRSKIICKTKTDETGKASLRVTLPGLRAEAVEVALFARSKRRTFERIMEIHELRPDEKTILVVDKEEGNRALVKKILESIQYRVFTATTGMDAWQVICNNIPDIVFIFEELELLPAERLIHLIRKKDETKNTLIVLVYKHVENLSHIDLNDLQALLKQPIMSRELLTLSRYLLLKKQPA